ncbi:hypothetical protein NQ315_008025 [Exocentrus adspersus]|uniref:Uncharacterized protein n=1 Tax=Exocentrus adspersus TaxID=1586481 RepID=A0AAV8VVD7_9CUCU|nr:hypothetical protein NQ315_008025 [Exocentrus adspersus]
MATAVKKPKNKASLDDLTLRERISYAACLLNNSCGLTNLVLVQISKCDKSTDFKCILYLRVLTCNFYLVYIQGEAYALITVNSRSVKIARERPNIEGEQSSTPEDNQEWKKFVGSIRRKVQRHASGSSDQQTTAQPKGESVSRKNSLTHSKFDMFRKDKSEDRKDKKSDKQPLTKQKSIGLESTSTSKPELFKALSFRDKSKSVSVKHVDTLVAPKLGNHLQKGVRKSDKKDSDRTVRPSISFSRSKSSASKCKEGLKQDDFLKATMRIFLVVSPPVGKMQETAGMLKPLIEGVSKRYCTL